MGPGRGLRVTSYSSQSLLLVADIYHVGSSYMVETFFLKVPHPPSSSPTGYRPSFQAHKPKHSVLYPNCNYQTQPRMASCFREEKWKDRSVKKLVESER